jgi:hypothetical protein
MNLFDRCMQNAINFGLNPKARTITWFSNKLMIYFSRPLKQRPPTAKKPPWNHWYLSAAALGRLGWKWVAKVSPVASSPPSTQTKQPVIEQPAEIKIIPLREPSINRRVQVFWGYYKKFFYGTIVEIDCSRTKSCYVKYDDGDEEWELPEDCIFLETKFDESPNACSVCFKKCYLEHCSRCKKVQYCSKECQRKDWPEHKQVCKI